jgi:glycosyltransferase involved in cell wall biosynthesis
MSKLAESKGSRVTDSVAWSGKCEVLVFRKDLLPISETFIVDQFKAYERYHPVLGGYRRVNGVPTPTEVLTLFDPPTLLNRAALKLAQHGQYLGFSPRGLTRLIDRLSPSLIHAHFGYDAILVYDAARRANIPLVVTLHGSDIQTPAANWESGQAGQFFRGYPSKLRKLISDTNVHFVAVSKALRQSAIDRGIPDNRLRVIYTGVSTDTFPKTILKPPLRRDIIFIGRLAEVKGLEFLIRAMAIVNKSLADVRLVVIGDGPLRPSLSSLAEQLKINVHFVGAAPRSVVKSHLQSARALCLPSITTADGCFEAFGMVALEAASSGVPVITSARGAAESIVEGVTGNVVPERDVEALAERILRLSNDDTLFSAMSDAAAMHARANFDVRSGARALESYYDDILRGASSVSAVSQESPH